MQCARTAPWSASNTSTAPCSHAMDSFSARARDSGNQSAHGNSSSQPASRKVRTHVSHCPGTLPSTSQQCDSAASSSHVFSSTGTEAADSRTPRQCRTQGRNGAGMGASLSKKKDIEIWGVKNWRPAGKKMLARIIRCAPNNGRRPSSDSRSSAQGMGRPTSVTVTRLLKVVHGDSASEAYPDSVCVTPNPSTV